MASQSLLTVKFLVMTVAWHLARWLLQENSSLEVAMGLGIPGRILDIYQSDGLRMGKVDFGGVVREACLEYIPEAQVGDYTIIHVGFAISLLSEQEALESLALLREIGSFEE